MVRATKYFKFPFCITSFPSNAVDQRSHNNAPPFRLQSYFNGFKIVLTICGTIIVDTVVNYRKLRQANCQARNVLAESLPECC